jgi:monovalent cation:H+ antiporter-2, CPA2 family
MVIFLVAAVIVVSISVKFKSSPIFGYLIAGIILGPYGLSLVKNPEQSKVLSELGLIFLFFTIGIGLPIERLRALRKYMFGLGSLQVLACTSVLSLLAYLTFDLYADGAFIIGAAMSLSSTAVVLQLLSEGNQLSARHGRISFSILLFQDIAVIIITVLLPFLQGYENSLISTLFSSVLQTVLGLIGVMVLGRIVIRPLFKMIGSFENSELFTAFTMAIILGTSLCTAKVGASTEIGAFIVGILLAETEYRHKIEQDTKPFKGLLLGVFFLSIGLSIDMKTVVNSYSSICVIVSIIVLIKYLIVYYLCNMFSSVNFNSVRVGSLIASSGELSFIILQPAIDLNIIPLEIGNKFMAASALSMALTSLFKSIGDKIARKMEIREESALWNHMK